MTQFVDENGAAFELIDGWHEYTYRKMGKEYVISGESIVSGLGEYKFGRAFWLRTSRIPHSDEAMVRHDIETAFAAMNGKAVFE